MCWWGAGHLTWSGALIAALSATLLADVVWFLAGRWRGRPCQAALPDCVGAGRVRAAADGGPVPGMAQSLLVAKFIPGLSTIAPAAGGIVGLGLPLFLLYDALGCRLGWVGIGVGLLFSGQVEQALAYSERVGWRWVLATVILFRPTSAGRRGICADNFRRSRE